MQAQLPFAVVQNIIRLADGDDLSATDDEGSFAAPSFVQRRKHNDLDRQIYGLRLDLTAVWAWPVVAKGAKCGMAPPPPVLPSLYLRCTGQGVRRRRCVHGISRRRLGGGSLLKRRLLKLLTNIV